MLTSDLIDIKFHQRFLPNVTYSLATMFLCKEMHHELVRTHAVLGVYIMSEFMYSMCECMHACIHISGDCLFKENMRQIHAHTHPNQHTNTRTHMTLEETERASGRRIARTADKTIHIGTITIRGAPKAGAQGRRPAPERRPRTDRGGREQFK